jgi:hypothetical protein
MHQKMITLCTTTFLLAKRKENFSEWVRQQLLNEEINEDGSHPIDLEQLFDDRFRKGKSNITPVLDDRYRKGES